MQEDYEADERGELPPDMKRGVLSQDALYNLLEGAGDMILFGNINRGLEDTALLPALSCMQEPDEYNSGHIPGAVNEPLSTIARPPFPRTFRCSSTACGTRSKRAKGILKGMGHKTEEHRR